MRKTLLLLCIVLLAAGCEKVLDIDDSDAHDLLVLNAVPADGRRAFVNLTASHFFLDSVGQYPVDGAALTLYINGVPAVPDSIARCNYFFPDTLRGGDSLALDISTPRGSIHAATTVPPTPAISHFRVGRWASPTFNFYLTPFTLADPPARRDYYHINVTIRDSGLRYDPWEDRYDSVDTVRTTYFTFFPDNPDITSNDVSPNIALADFLYGDILFTDRRIDGQSSYQVNLGIPIIVDTNEVNDSLHLFKHWYTVNVESITLERMRYLVSVARANSFTSFFAEQAKPYTNVSGAVGIFAGGSRWSRTFDADTVATLAGGAPTP